MRVAGRREMIENILMYEPHSGEIQVFMQPIQLH